MNYINLVKLTFCKGFFGNRPRRGEHSQDQWFISSEATFRESLFNDISLSYFKCFMSTTVYDKGVIWLFGIYFWKFSHKSWCKQSSVMTHDFTVNKTKKAFSLKGLTATYNMCQSAYVYFCLHFFYPDQSCHIEHCLLLKPAFASTCSRGSF